MILRYIQNYDADRLIAERIHDPASDAGRLTRDGSRDISSIRYEDGGHPSLVTFGNPSTVSYRRDGLGNLLETVYSERSGGTASVPTFRLGER